MKALTTLCCFFCLLSLYAQNPTVNLVIEEQPIPEPAYSTIQTEIGGTPVSYRLYVEIPENYELQIVYGLDETNPLTIITEGSAFYQSPLGGPTTLDINASLFPTSPELAFDSWLTIGADQMDNNLIYVLPDPSVFAAWEAGGNLNISDGLGGGVYITTLFAIPQNTPDANGRVLIGQFTTNEDVFGCLNLQLRRLNPDGTVYDPDGPETSETALFQDVCFNTYPTNQTFCPADFNISGNVAMEDLLIFLQDFGCSGGCIADLDGNDHVNAGDLLVFLSQFNSICYE